LRNQSGSTLALTADEKSIYQGSTVTFTATVQPTISNLPVPTGSVKFLYNGQTLGVATLQAGSASLAVTALPVGSDTVTAVYQGDTNYSSTSTGASVVVAVAPAPALPADFVVDVPSGGVTITSGSKVSLSFSVLANASFNGTVAFSATNLPAAMSVNFTPASLSLAPGATATDVLSISTSAQVVLAGMLGLPCLGLLAFFPGNRRSLRRPTPLILLSVCSLVGLLSLAGCGSSPVNATPAGDYTIIVKATPSVSGVSAKSFNVLVHIQ
jgi:hypothetical protein